MHRDLAKGFPYVLKKSRNEDRLSLDGLCSILARLKINVRHPRNISLPAPADQRALSFRLRFLFGGERADAALSAEYMFGKRGGCRRRRYFLE